MRIAVLGGGSLGSLFASHFKRAGIDTTLLLRPDAAHRAGPTRTVRVTAGDGLAAEETAVACEAAGGVMEERSRRPRSCAP